MTHIHKTENHRKPDIPRSGRLLGRTRRTLTGLVVAAVALATVVGTASPAAAVSWVSGKNPHTTNCDVNGWQWTSGAVPIYDGTRLIARGYLRYSGGCVANWSRVEYVDSYALNNYSIHPWAWEDGTTGTDQGPAQLFGTPVYSKMVDGTSTACAGAHVYRWPSNQWVKWQFFTCA